jgi:selenophosphate synthetase-related protein
MTLGKYEVELVKKYSFIDDCKLEKGNFVIYYNFEGLKKKKQFPIRSDVSKIQKAIRAINKELDVSIYGAGRNQTIYTTV